MKITKKVSFIGGIALFLLLSFYIIWVNTNLGSDKAQSLKIDVSVSYGDSSTKGNLVGIQAFMEPVDYASEENFYRKVEFYLKEANKKHWLIPSKTIVVFPEYFGTWLVVANEKQSIYADQKIETGLQTIVLRNLGKFISTYINCPTEVQDKIKYSAFAMKASSMARIYQKTFSALSQKYQITIVAGSILLSDPTVVAGILRANKGLLYNTSAVFGSDGKIKEYLVKKAFPTADELPFVCSVEPKSIPVFDTSVGRMGILICADAWFSAAYSPLKENGVDFVITPSYSSGYGLWNKPWSGYSGAETPLDAKADVGKISLGDAWVKYAMASRAQTDAGVKKGMNVFLQGNLWDLGTDGSTIILDDSAKATSYFGKAALVNLWL